MSGKDTAIVILGAGPAGAAVALGLKRLGYQQLTVVAEKRPFQAMEGISERVIEGLKGAGFKHALEKLPEPSPRSVTWNGSSSAANTERLIDRSAFDQALMMDLAIQGIHVIQGRAGKVNSSDSGHKIEVESAGQKIDLDAGFLVEARGRAAPAAKLKRFRGAETVSLLQYWQGEPLDRHSAVESFADGWAWMAADEVGMRYLQLTFDVATTVLPEKSQLVDFCNRRFAELPQAQEFLAGASPLGEIHARTSTPILCEEAVGDNWIRVGDAAMSVDPLSGNGIFQALSSSLQAPAVVNTLLSKAENKKLARQFHQLRVTELFYRFARIGRDFYAMEEQWSDTPFWQMRAKWPDQKPLHLPADFSQIKVCTRPVVSAGLIEPAEVVVTPDQPLGIWHLAGMPLAPVVIAAQESSTLEVFRNRLQSMDLTLQQKQMAEAWVLQQGADF